MKDLLIVVLFVFAVFKGWEFMFKGTTTPLYETPYIAVYGRNTCGNTKRMLRDLDKAGVEYKYFIIDQRETADLIHERMRSADLSTRRYTLPVVDVYGSISTNPDSDDVISLFNAFL